MQTARQSAPRPVRGVGIGLRAPHYREVLQRRPRVDWLEVHTENLLEAGGWDAHVIEQLRTDYPISLHGVGLGLGSADGFSQAHLDAVAAAVRRIEPALVSEHLCWGATAQRQFNDLLPMPLTMAALQLVAQRVDQVQQQLGRQLLIENVSTYLRFCEDSMSEAQFLAELVRRTGCGVLLDINNLYVNQHNHGEDAVAAMLALPRECVGEMHLAGHLVSEDLLIDHHGARVAAPVWALYRRAIEQFGDTPALIEWDTDLPQLATLLEEADTARTLAQATLRAGDRSTVHVQQQQMAAALCSTAAAADAVTLFNGPAERVAQRLALYRGNLTASAQKAMAAAYPVLRLLVGDAFFDAMSRAYVQAHPSRSGDLNRFGDTFAEFLSTFDPVACYPYFPDMARCEWAVHRAHFAAQSRSLDAAMLARVPPQELDQMSLALHPACTLIASSYAVVDIWQAHQPETATALPTDPQIPNHGVTVRSQWHVDLLTLSPAAHALLAALQAGRRFGDAFDAAFACDDCFDIAVHLRLCLQHGILLAPDHLLLPASQ